MGIDLTRRRAGMPEGGGREGEGGGMRGGG